MFTVMGAQSGTPQPDRECGLPGATEEDLVLLPWAPLQLPSLSELLCNR